MSHLLLITLLSAFDPSPELITPIEWTFTAEVDQTLTIRSYFVNFGEREALYLTKNYTYSIAAFRNYIKASCSFKPLEIRIISVPIMNSTRYFAWVEPVMFGRYFRETAHIYLTLEALKNRKYFAHEMGHYMYDTCGIKFASDELEHVDLEKFLKTIN